MVKKHYLEAKTFWEGLRSFGISPLLRWVAAAM
jgi:hypothetical protein